MKLEPKLNQLPFDGTRILSEISKEELFYVITMIPLLQNKNFDGFPMELYYKNYKSHFGEGNALDLLKEILGNSSLTEIRQDIVELIQGQEYFSLDELEKVSSKPSMEPHNIIKICLFSIITDEYMSSFINDYINCSKYINILEKVETYLKDSIDYLSIGLVTLLYYLNSNKEVICGYEDKIYSLMFKYYSEHMIKSVKQKTYPVSNQKYEEVHEEYIKLEEKHNKLKEDLKELKNENKELKKIKSQVQDILKDIKNSVGKNQVSYEQVFKDVKDFKYDVLENTYKTMVSNLTTQISELKVTIKELRDKNKELNETVDELTFNLEEREFSIKDNQDDINEVAVEIAEPEVVNKIGYCEIIDNVHYVKFLNEVRQELLNLPERIYLADNQFILVDNDGSFLYSYSYFKSTNIIGGITLGVIRERYGKFIVTINEKETDIKLPTGFNYKDNQVVGFDNEGNMKILFKYVKSVLDFFINSIKAKNHTVYFVLKKLSNGLMIRDVFENQEKFINEIEGEQVSIGDILYLSSDGELIKIVKSSRFYTTSELYHNKSYAVVIDIDGEFYCKNQDTGEVLKINSSNREIQDGNLVVIDEFVNVLAFVDNEMEHNHVIEQRQKRKNATKKNKLENIDIKHKVLILGNISYENNYKLSFYKRGYSAEVIDGYSPFNKVLSALRNVDYAIVIGGHTAHDNMWQIKDQDVPVIFPKTDGANSVLDEFEAEISKGFDGLTKEA